MLNPIAHTPEGRQIKEINNDIKQKTSSTPKTNKAWPKQSLSRIRMHTSLTSSQVLDSQTCLQIRTMARLRSLLHLRREKSTHPIMGT